MAQNTVDDYLNWNKTSNSSGGASSSTSIFTPGGTIMQGPSSVPLGTPASGDVDASGNVIGTSTRKGDYVYSGGRAYLVPNSPTDIMNKSVVVRGGYKQPTGGGLISSNTAGIKLGAVAGAAAGVGPGAAAGAAAGAAGGPLGSILGGIIGGVIGAIGGAAAGNAASYESGERAKQEEWRRQLVDYNTAVDFYRDENGKLKYKYNFKEMAEGGPLSSPYVLKLQNQETSVSLGDDGVLRVNVSPVFAQSDYYKSIVEDIKTDYAGLSKSSDNYEQKVQEIRDYIESAKKQYLAHTISYADYKAKYPDASPTAIVAGYTTSFAGNADPKDMDKYTVYTSKDGEITETNAKDYFDNIYNMNKDERNNYVKTLMDTIANASASQDDKAIAYGDLQALYAVSANKYDYKDPDDKNKHSKYQNMLDADWIVTFWAQFDILDDVFLRNGRQEYLIQDESAKLAGLFTSVGINTAITIAGMELGGNILQKLPFGKALFDMSMMGEAGQSAAFLSAGAGSIKGMAKVAGATVAFNTLRSAMYNAARSGIKLATGEDFGEVAGEFGKDLAVDTVLGILMQTYSMAKFQATVDTTTQYVYRDPQTGNIKILKTESPSGYTDVEEGITYEPVAKYNATTTAKGTEVGYATNGDTSVYRVGNNVYVVGKDGKTYTRTADDVVYEDAPKALKSGVVEQGVTATSEQSEVMAGLKAAGLPETTEVFTLPSKDAYAAVAAGKFAKVDSTKVGYSINKNLFNTNAALDYVNERALARTGDRTAWQRRGEVFAGVSNLSGVMKTDVLSGKYSPDVPANREAMLRYREDTFRSQFGKMTKADNLYMKAKESIARAQLAQKELAKDSGIDLVAEAIRVNGKYINGVSPDRAAALDEYVSLTKKYLNSFVMSVKKSGYVDNEVINHVVNSDISRKLGYVPMWGKKENEFTLFNQYFSVDKSRLSPIKSWNREGEIVDVKDIYDFDVSVDMATNMFASNMAQGMFNQEAIGALKDAGMAVDTKMSSAENRRKLLMRVENYDAMKKQMKKMISDTRKFVKENVPSQGDYKQMMEKAYADSGVDDILDRYQQVTEKRNRVVSRDKSYAIEKKKESLRNIIEKQARESGAGGVANGAVDYKVDGNGVKTKAVSIDGHDVNIDYGIADQISELNGKGYKSMNSHSGLASDHEKESDAGHGYIQFSGLISTDKKADIKRAAEKADMAIVEQNNPFYGPVLVVYQNKYKNGQSYDDLVRQANLNTINHYKLPRKSLTVSPLNETETDKSWSTLLDEKGKMHEGFKYRDAELKRLIEEAGGLLQDTDDLRKASWDTFFGELGISTKVPASLGQEEAKAAKAELAKLERRYPDGNYNAAENKKALIDNAKKELSDSYLNPEYVVRDPNKRAHYNQDGYVKFGKEQIKFSDHYMTPAEAFVLNTIRPGGEIDRFNGEIRRGTFKEQDIGGNLDTLREVLIQNFGDEYMTDPVVLEAYGVLDYDDLVDFLDSVDYKSKEFRDAVDDMLINGNAKLKAPRVFFKGISKEGNHVNEAGDFSWLDSGKYDDESYQFASLDEDAAHSFNVDGKENYIIRYHLPEDYGVFYYGHVNRGAANGGAIVIPPIKDATVVRGGDSASNGAEYVDVYVGKAKDDIDDEWGKIEEFEEEEWDDDFDDREWEEEEEEVEEELSKVEQELVIEADRLITGTSPYNEIFGRTVDTDTYIDTYLNPAINNALYENDMDAVRSIISNGMLEVAPYTSRSSVLKSRLDGVADEWRKWAKENVKLSGKAGAKTKSQAVDVVAEEINGNTVDGYEMGAAKQAIGYGYTSPFTAFRNGHPYTVYAKADNEAEKRIIQGIEESLDPKQVVARPGVVRRVAKGVANSFRLLTSGLDASRAVPNLTRDTVHGEVASGSVSYWSVGEAKKVLSQMVIPGNYSDEQVKVINDALDYAVSRAGSNTYNKAYGTPRKAGKELRREYLQTERDKQPNKMLKFAYNMKILQHDMLHDWRHIFEAPSDFMEGFTRKRLAAASFVNTMAEKLAAGEPFENQLAAADAAAWNAGNEYTANFGRKGKVVGEISSYTAYFSQNFANIESFKRAYINNPQGVARNFAIFLVAYMFIMAETLSDEKTRKQYYRLDEYDRSNSVVVPLGDGSILTLPLDETLAGLMFPFRRILETMNNVDPVSFYEFVWGTLTDPLPFDMSGFSEGDYFNFRRGIEKLMSQGAPDILKRGAEVVTGYNLYYGSSAKIDDDYLKQQGIYDPEAGDYTSKSKNSATLRAIANATGIPQWQLQSIVANFGSNIGSYVLNTIDKLASSSEEEHGGKDFVNSIFKSFLNTDKNAADSEFYTLTQNLKKDKNKLIQKIHDLNEKMETASGQALYALKDELQKAKDEYATKVGDAVNQYLNAYELTGGLSHQQANQVYYLFKLNDSRDNVYEYGSVGAYFNKQADSQDYNEATSMGASVLDKYFDQSDKPYLDKNGVWRISPSYSENNYMNTVYGKGMQYEVDLRNLIEGKNNSLKDAHSRAYNARRDAANSGDWDRYNQIALEWDRTLLNRISDYITRNSAEHVLTNSTALDYLENWIMVPSDWMTTKKGRYVSSLAHNASKEAAFKRPYLKYLFGVDTGMYAAYDDDKAKLKIKGQ